MSDFYPSINGCRDLLYAYDPPPGTRRGQYCDESPFSSLSFAGRTVLTVAEVAKALHISADHVIDLCNEGLIAAIDTKGLGNKSPRQCIRIPVSAYDAYIRANRIGPRPPES